MDKINKLSFEEFIAIFGNIIEHCPVIIAGVWSKLPFLDVPDFYNAVCKTVDDLPFCVKEGILRCHPDLAGKLSQAGSLTSESTNEQQSAGLLKLSPDEKQYLAKYNTLYKAKFRAPFVICVRENKKLAIMEGIKQRLENSTEDEILNGIEEVKKISYIRLNDVMIKLQADL